MIPATAMSTSRTTMTIAVAGRKREGMLSALSAHQVTREMMRPPTGGGLIYMKERAVSVGRAGRLSVHTLDERAHGMRGNGPPSFLHASPLSVTLSGY